MNNAQVYKPLTSLEDFCAMHGLESSLLPIERRVNEWDRLRMVNERLNAFTDTTQTFKLHEILDGEQIGGDTQLVSTFLWLCGSYPTHKARRKTRWSNPNYLHGDAHIEPASDRITHVEKACELPTITRTQLGDRFGIQPNSLTNWMLDHDVGFQRRRQESRARIGRSIKLTAEWSDMTIRECCRIFPAGERTARTWVYDFAKEFEVPEYPPTARW